MERPEPAHDASRSARPRAQNSAGYEPSDEMVESEPLDLGEDAEETVIRQQNAGPGSELGGGEFPDRDTPPSDAAGARGA